MTLTNEARSVTYTGNGVTTAFPFNFRVPEAEHLVVTLHGLDEDDYTELDSSEYSASGFDTDAGGSVTYPTAGTPISSSFELIIERTLPITQDTTVRNQGGFLPETVEEQLDRMTMMIQQVSDEAARAFKAPPGGTINNVTVGAEGTVPKWDGEGNLIEGPTTSEIEGAEAAAVSAAASAAAALVTLGEIEDLAEAIGEAAGEGLGDMLSTQNLSDLVSKHAGFDNLHLEGADIPSAATLDLSTATGWFVDVTGTTTITAVTLPAGKVRLVRFTAALQITVGASLVGNAGGSNINVSAGDLGIFVGDTGGITRFAILRVSGVPVTSPAGMASLTTEDQLLSGGAGVTSKSGGTVTSGTYTPEVEDRPLHHATFNGALTLAPSVSKGCLLLQVTNGASAGAVTTSGFTKVDGAFTTTSGDDFICTIIKSENFSYLGIKALQ